MRYRVDRAYRRAGLAAALLLLGSHELAAQEQDELDFGRLSLAIGSGARALGMGGAFLARPDDATAASWNPAGLSYLRELELCLVGVYGTQDSSTRNQAGTLLKVSHTQGHAPDFVALALPLSLGSTSGAVQLSFQRIIPYTGQRTIDLLEILQGESPRRFEIEAAGGFDVIAFSTGFKLAPWLRAGVSVNRWMNGFTQHRERLPTRRSVQESDFSLSGWNLNAGLILHPHENVNIGIVGKTPTSADVRLARSRADFTTNPGGPDTVTRNAYTSDDVRLDLPGAVGFGASWRASSVLTISGDYTRTFWSRSYIYNYFILPATPENAAVVPAPIVFPVLSFPNVLAAKQNDTQELRLGIEYVVISGRLKLPLRAGYVREKQSRVNDDGTSPRLDGVTAGVGLVLGPVLLDAAYVYQWGAFGPPELHDDDRLHRFLVSVIYRHGTGS